VYGVRGRWIHCQPTSTKSLRILRRWLRTHDRWHYCHPTSGGGPRSRCPTRPKTQHEAAHCESDVIMLLYQLRQLRQLSRPVGQELVAQLVHPFVVSKLDLENTVLANVGDHTASMRSERSSAADYQHTDERTRDTSSEAAPLVARRPSSGLQIVHHHDALNPHRSASDVFFRHGACRRRQPDEVRSAIRRHLSIH